MRRLNSFPHQRRKITRSSKIMRPRKISKGRKIIWGVSLLFILTILLGVMVIRSGVLLINRIEIVNSANASPSFFSALELQKTVETWSAQTLFTLSPSKEQAKLLTQFPALKELTILKKWPRQVQLQYEERVPFAVVNSNAGSFFIDSQGVVFSVSKEGYSLPLFANELPDLSLGFQLDSDTWGKTVSFVTELPQLGFTTSSFDYSQDRISVQTREEVELVFSPARDLDYQLSTLEVVWRDAELTGKKYKKIDLRFNRPVVVEK